MEKACHDYIEATLALYLALPGTPRRWNRLDRQLASQFYERKIPLEVIECAFLLAVARRTARSDQARPLGPIRSLHYFLPVIEEVLSSPPSASYVAYLRRKVSICKKPADNPLEAVGASVGLIDRETS